MSGSGEPVEEEEAEEGPVGGRGNFVALNVGGTRLWTTLSTLQSCPGSMLAAMFGPSWNEAALPRDSEGAFLLDSDPRFFRPILNYLRRGEVLVDPADVPGVLAEAKYFGLEPLVQRLGGSTSEAGQVRWADIGGLGGVKEELQAAVGNSVRHAQLFERCGVSPSKNLLLYGPPGCGKTLLAKATANDIKANFILIKCPELLAGQGGRRLQDKFAQARALQPCVVYLEEFEAIANSADAAALIVSQMAISMDQVLLSEKVFVFAATNRPDLIDPALLRPGRFDQLIYVPLPGQTGREEILLAALRKAPLHEDVSIPEMAKLTDGLSGADLQEVCKRACKFAIRESIANGTTADFKVCREHFERALKYARPSVEEEDNYRFDHFNRILKQISNPSGLTRRKSGTPK